MADELKRCLRLIMDTNGDDVLPTVYLITNKLAPAHEAVEMGIGEGILHKVCCPSAVHVSGLI